MMHLFMAHGVDPLVGYAVNNAKLDLASREVIPLAQRFAANLPKPNGFTNKPTRGAGGPTSKGTSPRYSVKLRTLPLCGSLNQAIVLFLRLSYYYYSTLTSPTCMELTPKRSRQARTGRVRNNTGS